MGNLLCVHVHAANIHDTKGGVYTFEKALYRYPTIKGVRADQGYRGTFKNTFETFHDIPVDISPRIKNAFEIQPLRWIVERTFSWFNGSRRLDSIRHGDYALCIVHIHGHDIFTVPVRYKFIGIIREIIRIAVYKNGAAS